MSRFPRSAARVRPSRRFAACKPSSRTSWAVDSPLSIRRTWAPKAPITVPWLGPLLAPERQASCAQASRQPAGNASSRRINRPKLDPCDVRGLIRADAARAFITGLEGLTLSPNERAFLREAQPWGLIIFKRNVSTPDQVTELVQSFRESAGSEAPVLVDQEGGRVQRLGPPHW